MPTVGKTRKFNGKVYHLAHRFITTKSASAYAKSMRAKGKLIRVVKAKTHPRLLVYVYHG